jgi:hypothetical protein
MRTAAADARNIFAMEDRPHAGGKKDRYLAEADTGRRFDDAGAPMILPMPMPRRFLRRPRLNGLGALSAGRTARLGMALPGHVSACPTGRLCCAVPAHDSPTAAFRRGVDARDQARRLRVIARKIGERVRLYSRPGNDLTDRGTIRSREDVGAWQPFSIS